MCVPCKVYDANLSNTSHMCMLTVYVYNMLYLSAYNIYTYACRVLEA